MDGITVFPEQIHIVPPREISYTKTNPDWKPVPLHFCRAEKTLLMKSKLALILTTSSLALAAGIPTAEAGQGPQPSICTRACWGARAARSCATISTLNRAIIHHTGVASHFNTSGLEASKSLMRGLQNYDMDNKGYCDIIYNFLVDKYGNIFEARANSMAGLPNSSHDSANANSFGFTLLGNFDPASNPNSALNVPSGAMINALYDVIAWRMPPAWSPYGTGYPYCGDEGCKTVGWLDGHRSVKATACPGNNFYNVHLTSNYSGGPARDAINARRNGTPTINPPFYFDTDAQGWSAGNAMTGINWISSGWPGVIYADQVGSDAFIYGPLMNYTGYGAGLVNVQVFAQSGSSASHNMQMFWSTAAEPYFDAVKSSPIVNYVAQDNWIRLNLNVNSYSYANQSIRQFRLDFDQSSSGTRWIVNHVLPQYSPWWTFDSDAMGWTVGNAVSPIIYTASGWPGVIYFDQTGNDAFIYASRGYFDYEGPNKYLGGANDRIRVRVYPQSGNSASHDMQVFWITSTDGAWSASKSSAIVNYTAQNGWVDVNIPVGDSAEWNGGAGIQQIRLDFDQTTKGTRWIVDSITIEQN